MSLEADHIPALLDERARLSPDGVAFRHKPHPNGPWISVTWKEFRDRADTLASTLLARGLAPGDPVALMAANDLRWELIHHAVARAGGALVAIDPHDPHDRVRQILDNAKPRFLFVQRVDMLSFLSFEEIRPFVWIVALEGETKRFSKAGPDPWDEISAPSMPSGAPPPADGARMATILYTSGTTGDAKGVAYSHRQIVQAARAITDNYAALGADSRLLCWLPLSNLFQRMTNLAAIHRGCETWIWEDPRRVLDGVKEARPDVFISVPRFYEKVYAGIEAAIGGRPFPLRAMARFAIAIGGRWAATTREGRTPGILLKAARALADRWVLRRLRGVMGDRVRFLVSGSAPMPPWLLEYYHALGLLVLEAYGLSENVIPVAMNRPERYRFGTVGLPLAQNDLRLGPAGEIFIRGPGVFAGYHGDPPDAGARPDGFFDTGDNGALDAEGFLTLTGRRSALIKTSTGRRIAPSKVEEAFQRSVLVDQAVVVGANHKRLAALVTLDWTKLPPADRPGTDGVIPPAAWDRLKGDLARCAAALPTHERPGGYLVLANRFSIDAGELTSNLKLRRGRIEERYRPWLDDLFSIVDRAEGEAPIFVPLTESAVREKRLGAVAPAAPPPQSSGARFRRLLIAGLRFAWSRLLDRWHWGDLGLAWRARRRHESLVRAGNLLAKELGALKGPAVKLGQMISYVAPQAPEALRRSMATLQAAATPLAGHRIRDIVEESLKRPIDRAFAEWSATPMAVGSMSQIHRARLRTGEEVVVKVLFPDITRVIAADLHVLRWILPLMGRFVGITNAGDLVVELGRLFAGECDLEAEAKVQEIFRAMFRDDPRVLIPRVHADHSGPRLLTMDFVNGVSYERFKAAASQKEKNLAGAAIFELAALSSNRYGIFNADPHPGNYLFMDGKVCFIDFGFVKRWPSSFIELWKQQSIAGMNNNVADFEKATRALGFTAKRGRVNYKALMEQYQACAYKPWRRDEPFRFDAEFLGTMDNLVVYSDRVGRLRVPPEFVAVSRLFFGQYALLCDLEAEANWNRLLMPHLHGPIEPLDRFGPQPDWDQAGRKLYGLRRE
jgi:long-chain acyl-CoA synthetase